MLSADSSFCVAYVEPPFRSFELSERRFGPIECGILESTEPPLNLVESSQRSSLSERVRPFAKTLGLFQLTGAARPLSFFMVSHWFRVRWVFEYHQALVFTVDTVFSSFFDYFLDYFWLPSPLNPWFTGFVAPASGICIGCSFFIFQR